MKNITCSDQQILFMVILLVLTRLKVRTLVTKDRVRMSPELA